MIKSVEDLEKKVRKFFVSNSIGSQYKLATIKEKAEFQNLEITTMDSSQKHEHKKVSKLARENHIKVMDSP